MTNFADGIKNPGRDIKHARCENCKGKLNGGHTNYKGKGQQNYRKYCRTCWPYVDIEPDFISEMEVAA